MQAAILVGPGQIRIEEVPLPEPKENFVRVRLEGCGLCGSNLAPWEGRAWIKYPFAPGAPGHEGWGIIDRIGPKVTRFQPGNRVAILSYNAFAEYDLASEADVVLLPDALKDQPFPGEALGCAVNVFRRCKIEAGQTVAVVGIGFLGALLVSMAVNSGAFVIALGRRAFALELARAQGAHKAICLAERSQVVDEAQRITQGQGCDCVIEATGQSGPLEIAAELTRVRGRLVIAGYHQDPRQINMQLWNWRGLDVINAHERDSKIYVQGMEAAVDAVVCGRLNPQPLFTNYYPLGRLAEAFQAMADRPDRFLKALITV